MNIIIIEDEHLTAKDLQKTLLSIDESIEIVAVLQSVEEALVFFKTSTIAFDLIFSDIELGDGLSFDIFSNIKNTKPIIFCTAYNDYALQAFNTHSIEYILKPFSKESVAKAIDKYVALKENFASANVEYNSIMQLVKAQISGKAGSVIIKQGSKIFALSVDEIALFYFENGYAFAYTFDQKTHILSKSLEELDASFTPHFFRANRQFLVNRKAIKDVTSTFNRKLVVNLTTPFKEEILIGKLKHTAFLEWLAAC